MTETFVSTEVDRTKSRWVAGVFREFGRPRTTVRALFYFALSRAKPDYPICGGFVGEIRVTRPYTESDSDKLAKWVFKARALDYLPQNSILDEIPALPPYFPPTDTDGKPGSLFELWINKPELQSLIQPLCERRGLGLVSVRGMPDREAVLALLHRSCKSKTVVLCLTDLTTQDFSFHEGLSREIFGLAQELDKGTGCTPDQVIPKVRRIGLTPQQVRELNIPTIKGSKAGKDLQERFRGYIRPFALDPKRIAELDALEVHHPRGLSGFLAGLLEEAMDHVT